MFFALLTSFAMTTKKTVKTSLKTYMMMSALSMIHPISMGKTVRMHFVMTGLRQHQ